MARLARETWARGFTTVRDLGGDVEGLRRAIAAGLVAGPHIVRAGRMLTQTGGHGDAESGPRPVPTCACEMRPPAFGIVAAGAAARSDARRVGNEGVRASSSQWSGNRANRTTDDEDICKFI